MQRVGPNLLAVLESGQRDLAPVDLFEFYAPTETDLFPENAVKRFAASAIVWNGWTYERQAISRGEISRFIDGKFNNCQITLSNIDRSTSTWLSSTPIEGYRIIVRMISRSVDDDSLVLGVFRCDKPFDVDNTTVTIQAKQDLGSIENDLPWTQIQPKCPLKFKGTECLAGQLLTAKSAAYQAATVCNKSWRQCNQDYDNGSAFQGVRFNAVTGNFKVSQRRGGAGGALLSLIGLGNKRVTKQYSSQDSAPYGTAVTLGLGRTQTELTGIVYADTGQYLAAQYYAGEGEITKFVRVFNVTSGWANTFQAFFSHRGKFGFDSEQFPLAFFASANDRHSHRAYIEITIKGDNPDTGDPAPTIVGVIMWLKIPVFDQSCFTATDWSDNPVEHLRHLLTEPRSLNYNAAWIDNDVARQTYDYCNEPLIDQTGGEDVYVSSASGTPGTDYKRYRSTGLLDTYYWLWKNGLTATYPAEREVTYNTFDASAPPANPTPSTLYRKRYTSNFHIREKVKVVDFIFKNLLPCFRGYLITGGDGKLQIKSERPTPNAAIIVNATAGFSSVRIEDVTQWKALNTSVVYALISVGEATSETRRITSITYEEPVGTTISISASGASGLFLTESNSMFSDTDPAATSEQIGAQVVVSGSVGAGKMVSITIDGTNVSYTTNANDTIETVAAIMATRVAADTTLNRYIQVVYTTSLPYIIRFRSKRGRLFFAETLISTHSIGEIVAHIALPFSDVAMGALTRGNILRDSFKWPLGNRQSSYNQFVLSYNDAPQDYQSTELRENDYDHQEKINNIAKLEISGACVDNYHQADRLVKGARFKYREGDYFNQLSSTGLALLLEEGDVICANHSNQPDQRNLMLRIEELKVAQDHKVSIIGRLYADAQFPSAAEERTISLTTGIGWVSTPPPAVFNLDVTSPSDGTLNVTFFFGDYIGAQTARIELKRDGETDFSDTGIRVTPDASNGGTFQLTGIPAGITEIRITPYSTAGDGPSTTSSFDSADPSVDILEYQIFDRPEVNLQVEDFS